MWELLKRFYPVFGVNGEGPAEGQEPPDVPESSSMARDAQLVTRMLATPELIRLHADCRALLEEIAENSGRVDLLEELNQHFDLMGLDPDALFNGILWYTQAAHADPRRGDSPLSESLRQHLGEDSALAMQVSGATVLRLYIALVYLRGDWIRSAIGRVPLDASPHLLRYARLFNHDLIRHARNALAHGHIGLTACGLRIHDRNFESILTPGFIDLLCTWVFLFHHRSFMVYGRRAGLVPDGPPSGANDAG